MKTAYTIGHTKNYDLSLAGTEVVYKVGKSDDYKGGWVWETPEEARTFINSSEFLPVDWGDGKSRDPIKFSVYQIELPHSWESDVSEPDQIGTRHLLHDAMIVSKYEY
jgi:hypothetical protein